MGCENLSLTLYIQTKSKKTEVSPFFIAVTKGNLELCQYVFFTKNQLANESNIACQCDVCFHMSMKKINVENHFANQHYISTQSLSTRFQVFFNTLAPIHIALVKGNLETFKLIFDNVEYKNPVYNVKTGNTLFHMAAKFGLTNQCQLIIENTDIKNPVNSRGETAFHLAALNGHLDVCKLITQNFENKKPVDNFGKTPLHYAALNGHFAICELIFENVENKNPADNVGETPLHLAAWNGHFSICELIIENVENKNPAGYAGITPLHWAARNVEDGCISLINQNDHLAICELMIENLDNKNPTDYSGKTPFDWAIQYGPLAVPRFIIKNNDGRKVLITQKGKLAMNGHLAV